MSPVIGGLGVVASPPAEPPRSGLIASLSGRYLVDDTGQQLGDTIAPGGPAENAEVRWEGAVRYNPEQVCYSGEVQDPCGPDLSQIPANPGIVDAIPFLVWAGDRCSSFGWSARDFVGRATRALLASESKQIAKELWTGRQAQASGWPNPYLASPEAQVLTATPVSPAQALDFLEQGLADNSTGMQGVIHCTRMMGSALSNLGNTVQTVNGLIVTYVGTLIIPDAGYDGSGPGGTPATNGSQWAYATLVPTVRRSPIEVIPGDLASAMIRGTNDIEWRANRLAVATFPPCALVAAQVNLAMPVGGVS